MPDTTTFTPRGILWNISQRSWGAATPDQECPLPGIFTRRPSDAARESVVASSSSSWGQRSSPGVAVTVRAQLVQRGIGQA